MRALLFVITGLFAASFCIEVTDPKTVFMPIQKPVNANFEPERYNATTGFKDGHPMLGNIGHYVTV